MGVNRQQILQVIKKITPDEQLVYLLGSFTFDQNKDVHNNSIRYNGRPYRIRFSIDDNKKLNVITVSSMPDDPAMGEVYRVINIDPIITKALEYVN